MHLLLDSCWSVCHIHFSWTSDVNECRNYPGRLCAHKCENIRGSYKCSCTTGFKLAHDERNCDGTGKPTGVTNNKLIFTPASFTDLSFNPQTSTNARATPAVRSAPMFTDPISVTVAAVTSWVTWTGSPVKVSGSCLLSNSIVCTTEEVTVCRSSDIDECALPTGGHICSYRCHNTPGSFHCTCPATGYTLAPNGRSCQGQKHIIMTISMIRVLSYYSTLLTVIVVDCE